MSDIFHQPATHAYILKALLQLVEERHGTYNGTLYQLEPNVKEAPGALRDKVSRRRQRRSGFVMS